MGNINTITTSGEDNPSVIRYRHYKDDIQIRRSRNPQSQQRDPFSTEIGKISIGSNITRESLNQSLAPSDRRIKNSRKKPVSQEVHRIAMLYYR